MKLSTCLKYLITLLLLLQAPGYKAQAVPLKSASWEKHLPAERFRFNYSLGHKNGWLRKTTHQFFSTGSGHSGEIFQEYRLFQLGDEEELKRFRKILISIPPEARLTHLDYRIWKNNLIIYEGKARKIARQITDTFYHAASGQISAYQLQLDELEENCVVELFYQVEGVYLPYWLNFQDSLSWQQSVQEIRIISADPLQFVHHPEVKASETRNYDELVYRFEARDVNPASKAGGLPVLDTAKPYAAVEWGDLIQRYDREKIKTWFDFLPYLFFDDEIKNLAVYINSEARYLGMNIHQGAMRLPPKVYHTRDEVLYENYMYAWGRYTLGGEYAGPLVDLQEWVKALADSTHKSNLAGLKNIHKAVNSYISGSLQKIKRPPYAFYDYGIVSKFYTDFLKKRGIKYYPVLLKTKYHGPFLDSLVSTRQIDAMALAFDLGQQRHYFLLGPYLGNFYGLDSLPSDFSEGTAVVFDQEKETCQKVKLPAIEPQQSSFHIKDDVQISFKHNWYRVGRQVELQGNFQNQIYYSYLAQDTAFDLLSATDWTALNNAVNNRSKLEFKNRQYRMPEDSMVYRLYLNEALPLALKPAADYYAFPTPYEARLTFRLRADRPFEISPEPAAEWRAFDLFSYTVKSERISPSVVEIDVLFKLYDPLIAEAESEGFSEIVRLLQEGITLKITPPYEP